MFNSNAYQDNFRACIFVPAAHISLATAHRAHTDFTHSSLLRVIATGTAVPSTTQFTRPPDFVMFDEFGSSTSSQAPHDRETLFPEPNCQLILTTATLATASIELRSRDVTEQQHGGTWSDRDPRIAAGQARADWGDRFALGSRFMRPGRRRRIPCTPSTHSISDT